MAEDEEIEELKTKKGLLVPLLLGVILAAAGGGGGFWAVTQGPLASATGGDEHAGDDEGSHGEDEDHGPDLGPTDVAFLELETMVISLGAEESNRNLIFSAALEVRPEHLEEVTELIPRVLDVLNSYLRVIAISELSEPTSLARLRSQMLRRIQVVTGTGRVRDLLVTQFLVN
ncbi:flagellar basal body-associated FliL family protein [Rhodobacteraceae bacterium N5(2021)]|uniref:Flagellar protein FliL n=1 Tax=Gymnodinialimonas phycosphaerae TaxID=2841589 RepID=A0A975YEV7_9RHOB|nr:flagellar basal body-associated FliL family protein [Gymnodinialimonas phycosphaerae]MBY4894054.1 flagellar basal body-associated FliL family protein [Gymnodinialimonas phycosphaerae]